MIHNEGATVSLTDGAESPSLHLVPAANGVAVWAAVAAAAAEPCLVLGADAEVVAVSECGAQLLAKTTPEQLVGLSLVDSPVQLVDFTPDVRVLSESEAWRTPMISALRTQSQARGLVRIRLPNGRLRTVDVVATPLLDGDQVVGSLSFLAAV